MSAPSAPVETRPAVPVAGEDAPPYPSVDAVQEAHRKLRSAPPSEDLGKELRRFFRRARATGRQLGSIEERSAAQAILDYWAVRLGAAAATEDTDLVEDATLAPFEPEVVATSEPEENPYLRLREFLRRDELAARLAARLRESRAMALLGTDGSGRRSIVRDGVFPRLSLNTSAGGAEWRLIFVSLRREPLRDLARALAPADQAEREAFTRREAARLRAKPTHIRELLDAVDQPALLVIDGMDQLVAGAPIPDRERIVEALAAVIEPAGRHRLIFVVDPSSREGVQQLPVLGPLLEWVDTPPFTAAELRHAIVQPAARVGVKVDDAVVERLLNDVVGDPAAPALLQFALVHLWAHPDRRACGRITPKAYDESGGAQTTFEKIADAFFLSLDEEEQKIVQSIFLQLVSPDVLENRVVARSLSRSDLHQQLRDFPNEAVERVLTNLEAQFLLRSRDGKHLAPPNDRLLVRWPRLRQWLHASGRERSEREWLTLDARQWKDRNEDPSLLWKGRHLAQAWQELRQQGLSELELRFLTEGRAIEAAEQARWEKRKLVFVWILAGGALFAVVALAASIYLGNLRRDAAVVINEGLKSLEAGEPAAAAVLFAAAIKKELPFFGDREVHSTRLAAALRQMPRLIARLPHAAIAQEQFHPRDAHLLVTVGGDRGGATNFAAFWNLKTDKALQLSSGPGSEIDNVNFAAFSPVSVSGDGIIATAHGRRGGKGEVRLWSVKEALAGRAALLTTWPAPARVSRLVFSADGAAVALVLEREPGSDSEVRIHEVGQEKPPVAKQFTTGVNHVAFDPSGDLLAIACGTPLRGDRGEAVLWQWRQNTARTLVHAAPVNHAVFSPQGTQLLTASGADDSGGEARIWEVATGMPAALPPFAHRDNVPFASFSPDGERVATASRDNTARIWSRAHGFQIAELQHNGWVYEARFSPDGRQVVTSSRDRRARVWNADTGEPALPALNHSGTVLRATFSGDGRQVLAAGLDEARLWRLETGNLEVPPLAAADSVQVAAVSPDSTLAATATVATASASLVEVWRVADGHRAHTRRKLEGSVAAIAFTAQNRLVVAVGTTPAGGGFAALCDLQSEAPPRRREFKRPVTFVTAAHGAAPLLLLATATGNERGEAILWNHATDEAHAIAGPSAVVFATFAPNDETFLVAGGSRVTPSGFAQIWDTASRTPVCPAVEHLETVEAAAFNRDGSLFATASVDDSANVWNARTGRSESVRIRGVHTADVQAIAFSPNGDAILTGSYDGTAAYVKWKGWKDGDPTSVFRHQGAVNVVTFSPDGRRILTASDDQTARVWERSSGNLIALLRHGEEVRDARFAEDGRAVAVLATSRPPMLGSTRNTRDAEAEKFLRRAETRRWQLAPGEASLQTMLEEAQILANAKLQPPSRLVPLKTPAAVRPLVPERLPSQSGDEPVGELAFHLVQARHCETEQNWFATAWHLGRAVECARAGRHPAYELAALEERRGEAFYQLRRWEEAVPAFTAALELLGDSETARRGQIHARRVWARIESRDFAGATEDCHTLAQLWPRSHDPWTFLAWLHLEQNQLSALRSALQTGIERDPKAVTPWQRRAAAELWYGEGDASNYRVVCTEMWEKFRGTKGVGTRLAWPCCLAPDSGVDPSVLVSAVEETLKERPENYTDLNTYGAVLLRANRIDEAIGVLDRSRAAFIKARGSELQRLAAAGASSIAISDGRPQDWVLLALAWSRKGDRQRASHWVHKVEVALEQMGSGSRNEASTPRTPWSRIELELLRREAAAEIRKMSNDPTTAHSGL